MTTTQLPLAGIGSRVNRYAGTCVRCAQKVAAEKGFLVPQDSGGWAVVHSGRCPDAPPPLSTMSRKRTISKVVAIRPSSHFEVPEGYFTVVLASGDHRTIRVKRQGEYASFMPGVLVLSYLSGPQNTSDYTSFAHVGKDGVVYVWKRYRDAQHLHEAVRVLQGDPKACAKAYGMRSGRCFNCNRLLTDPESIARSMGPICASKVGWE